MKIFLTITVTAVLLVFELIAGNAGLALGLPLYGALFFAVAFGQAFGISAAGGAALLLDIIYARSFPFWSIYAMLAVFFASVNVHRMQRKQPLASLISGAFCGILIVVFNLLSAWISGEEIPGPDPFSLIVFHVFGGMIFMFLLVVLFDAVNLRSNLPRFGIYDSKSNLREQQL